MVLVGCATLILDIVSMAGCEGGGGGAQFELPHATECRQAGPSKLGSKYVIVVNQRTLVGRVRAPRWNSSGRCSGSMTTCGRNLLTSHYDGYRAGMMPLAMHFATQPERKPPLRHVSCSADAGYENSDRRLVAQGTNTHLTQGGLDVVQGTDVVETRADLAGRDHLFQEEMNFASGAHPERHPKPAPVMPGGWELADSHQSNCDTDVSVFILATEAHVNMCM